MPSLCTTLNFIVSSEWKVVKMLVTQSVSQSCPPLCDPMDCSPQAPSVHGISQERILEWVAISFSRVSFPPRDQTQVSCISCAGRQILYHQHHLRSSLMLISELTPEPQIPVFNYLLGRSLPGGTSYRTDELMRISSLWSGSYLGSCNHF